MISMTKKLMLVAVLGALVSAGGCTKTIKNPNAVGSRANVAKTLESLSPQNVIPVPSSTGS